jgi:hypothetical protein
MLTQTILVLHGVFPEVETLSLKHKRQRVCGFDTATNASGLVHVS